MRSLILAVLAGSVLCAAAPGTHAERNPVPQHPGAGTADQGVQRFIVKLKSESQPSASVKALTRRTEQRLADLASRTAVTLDARRQIAGLMYAIEVESAPSQSAVATLARLRADSSIEYADLDQRRYPQSVPANPLFREQWYLQPSSSTNPAAVDAQTAWDTTTGSTTLVVADIDTGVRADHPDLSARLLSGYCFISDSFTANTAGTSHVCPGAGAWDPGDAITSSEIRSHPTECGSGSSANSPAYSSWHGTRVAGVLGADESYSAGIVGVTWGPKILPVRALGRCGGSDSDIITAMLWAAGIPVTVGGSSITNPNPARIINMSLGGTGSCPSSYQDAVNQITAMGILIVASAGNEGGPVDAPANCTGVVAVAGLRNAGTKVGYSSLGPQITLGAPAGNCVNEIPGGANTLPCVDEILTTTNLGTYAPDANDYTGQYYCDPTTGGNANCTLSNGTQYRTYNLGTSFSAPIVSGIAALMASANTRLDSCDLLSRLKEGVLPYPQSSVTTSTVCHVPSGSSDVQNAECICTTDDQTCGAGMANAPGALAAALRPVAAVSVPASVSPGQNVTLDGSGSAAADGYAINTYQWASTGSLVLQIANGTTAKATVTAPTCGIGTVQLTVTDNDGRTDTAEVVVGSNSVSTAAPATASGSGSCTLAAPAEQLAVCPATSTAITGGSGQSFSADVVNASDTSVTWEVNGVAGGNTTVGTISSTGDYIPPSTVPTPSAVTVTAVSAADSSKSASAAVVITAPPPKSGGGGIDWLTLLTLGGLAAAAVRGRTRSAAHRS
ncbi:MAG: S8 family serine peptidase [Steroidobacteraceae bacterium]